VPADVGDNRGSTERVLLHPLILGSPRDDSTLSFRFRLHFVLLGRRLVGSLLGLGVPFSVVIPGMRGMRTKGGKDGKCRLDLDLGDEGINLVHIQNEVNNAPILGRSSSTWSGRFRGGGHVGGDGSGRS
jgi:hypothetical protein